MVSGGPSLLTVFIILSWYGSNIGVLLLNKVLLSSFKFKYPVFLTLCHMVACSGMSFAASLAGLFPRQQVKSRPQAYKVSVLAVVFCGAVALGNVSLRFIPVSFNQAIGATTPAFTALMTVMMTTQRESPAVYATLVPVVVGIVIASGAEPLFHMIGFLAAVAATSMRAFKSVLQGMLLTDSTEKLDSQNLLMYMAPVACLVLVPMTLIFEPQALLAATQLSSSSSGFLALLALNSCAAYFTNLTNFLVTKHTSALTLQVLGNAKGVVAVVVSVLYFRNPVNTYSILGYAITVTGVVLYSQAKKRAKKQDLLSHELGQLAKEQQQQHEQQQHSTQQHQLSRPQQHQQQPSQPKQQHRNGDAKRVRVFDEGLAAAEAGSLETAALLKAVKLHRSDSETGSATSVIPVGARDL